jgi:hypothetical protein
MMKFWSAAVSLCAALVAVWATVQTPSFVRADPAPTTTTTSPGCDVTIKIDATKAPELQEWADTKVVPVLKEWYPKIIAELPVEGYTPPDHFTITFDPAYKGVAATSGTHVVANPAWFLANEKGEGVGALLHEEVHVVQQPFHKFRGKHMPTWLLEGSCDYIRWFQFEPAKSRPHPRADRTSYDKSYRDSATFLQWVITNYDKNIVPEMNAANWNGTYSDDLWKKYTGKTKEELG